MVTDELNTSYAVSDDCRLCIHKYIDFLGRDVLYILTGFPSTMLSFTNRDLGLDQER